MKSHVAVAMPPASPDTAGAREFLQERIALWSLWVFVLSGGFLVVNVLTWPLVRSASGSFADTMLHRANLFHLAASLAFAVDWQIARHARPSLRGLRVLDAVALIGGCALFSLMGLYVARLQAAVGGVPAIGIYAAVLASANTVLARAIAVPSTPKRTFWLSVAAMLPLVPMTAFASGSALSVVNIATWSAVTVVVATAGSQVIFGLRTEAARVRRLGQYSLEEKIGEGSMAWLAR
jgi:hypothetical protein